VLVYCVSTEVDIPTARRDLTWLCEVGLLRRRGRGETARYDLIEQAR
jgi:DeoR/GlpR family transcriptional regulator of sugar metabolism